MFIYFNPKIDRFLVRLGPPGCGKTYLGVRLAEFFYHNRLRISGCQKPILMICYTNHALDQFLANIIEKLSLKPGEIVRVGGRSKHAELEPFLIQKLKMKRDRRGDPHTAMLFDQLEVLDRIRLQIINTIKKLIECHGKIISIEQFIPFMNLNLLMNLIEPVQKQLDIYENHWSKTENLIFCCKKARLDSDTSDNYGTDDLYGIKEDDENDDVSIDYLHEGESDDDNHWYDPEHTILSRQGRQKQKENRSKCHHLKKLSNEDLEIINQIFKDWLDFKANSITLTDQNDQPEGTSN